MKFDDLIREGRDTDAVRLMASDYYRTGKFGHTRMLLLERVANELDEKMRELSFTRGKQQKQPIRDFLADIANNEILQGKKYTQRIYIEDGGDNSYIGITVDPNDWVHKPQIVIGEISIFRNTNSTRKLENQWGFSLGNICHPYADDPNMPLKFTSFHHLPYT